MSRKIKSTLLLAGLVAMTGVAVAGRTASTATFTNPLRASVIADTDSARAFSGNLQFKLSNSADRAVKVLSWQLPNGALEADLFDVFRNGERVEYIGPQIKRAAPTEADYITLRAGDTKLLSANIAAAYDLLPRLKAIARQKLSLAASTDAAQYPNLEPILTRSINWELIRQQYDEIIKYTTAQTAGSHIAGPVAMDINATLDAWVDAYGRPAARVMLNGKGPFSFMVDTGHRPGCARRWSAAGWPRR